MEPDHNIDGNDATGNEVVPLLRGCPVDHPAVTLGRTGLLLLNLGTPDATDFWSVRRYLKQFLSDRRVIEVNPVLWWVLLNGVILNTRPQKTARAYKSIWNESRNESPLKTITRSQAEKVQSRFRDAGTDEVVVEWGMRYGNPSTEAAISRLAEQGCTRLVVLPLYPQYSASTTATACDEVFSVLSRMRWQPTLRVVPPYFEHTAYIETLAASVTRHVAALDFVPEVLLMSFHGLPQSYLRKGDPYHCHCAKTGRLLSEKLGWKETRIVMSFQSRFGNEPWLQPYTDETVADLARKGARRIAVVAPGFASDCVETLEELNQEVREAFIENGGTHFAALPCLNDEAGHIEMLKDLAMENLAGWIDTATAPAAASVAVGRS
ncbi:ferrochelatase [Fodinicurvata sp. EGI_FJ10296]|uniref:ferrochelatase n=1 Tax=Fodinicurvata sp. EGI_FJ10296 TaxID=3231908 RepID=UPI003457224D